MTGEEEKSLSTLSHILKREKMRIQDHEVGEEDFDEQPQIKTDWRSRLNFAENLQNGPYFFLPFIVSLQDDTDLYMKGQW